MRIFFTYLVIVLFTVAPILSIVLAGGIADVCGCQLNEGSKHPCILLGVDIGGLLYSMFVAGWFMLLTIPLGLLGLLLYTGHVLK